MPVHDPRDERPPIPMQERCVAVHFEEPERPRRAVPGLRLCRGHLNALEQCVAEAPALDLELQAALNRPEGGASEKVTRTASPGLVLNADVSDARAQLRDRIAGWCRIVMEERGLAGPRDAELTSTSPWLLQHVEWLAAQDCADDALVDIRDAVREARRRRQPSTARVIHAGPCQQSHDEVPCPGQVTAVVRGVDDLLPSELSCDVCGLTIPARDWRKYASELGKAVVSEPMSGPELSVMLEIPLGTIHWWAKTDHWRSEGGKYNPEDVQASYVRRRIATGAA